MANAGADAGIPWVMARFEYRNPTQRLRWAVEALPEHTKEAMLRGIARNRIIVGAYVDPRSGGICPMLAAHRNGGRTSLAAFARAWDAYTGAQRPRLARRREVATLVSFLEESLAEGTLGVVGSGSIAAAAAEIRSERTALAARDEARRESQAELTPPEPEGAIACAGHGCGPPVASTSSRTSWRRRKRSSPKSPCGIETFSALPETR